MPIQTMTNVSGNIQFVRGLSSQSSIGDLFSFKIFCLVPELLSLIPNHFLVFNSHNCTNLISQKINWVSFPMSRSPSVSSNWSDQNPEEADPEMQSFGGDANNSGTPDSTLQKSPSPIPQASDNSGTDVCILSIMPAPRTLTARTLRPLFSKYGEVMTIRLIVFLSLSTLPF